MSVIRWSLISSIILFLVLSLSSCDSKSKKEADVSTLSLPDKIVFQDSTLGKYFDVIDFSKLKRLTQAEYDSLHLVQINSLSGYDLEDLTMGQILFNGANGKLLTLKVITEGEITEYLLSYDPKGNLVDSLIVAYEDMVDYYSEVTTIIRKNQILVQTVNFTYDGKDGNEETASDTSMTKYRITPSLRFLTD